MKDLKDRRMQILFSIINSYILEGEPVGSKSLADDYSFDVSPATIRNDMSSLEKKGLLKKAHTSSGRLPSDKGYRFFVDHLLENGLLDQKNDHNNLRQILDKRYHNATDIVDSATKILATITNLTAVSITYKNQIKSIANIELLRVNDYALILIVVYDNGLVVNDLIYLKYEIDDQSLSQVNQILRSELVGSSIYDIGKKIISIEEKLNLNYKYLLDIIQTKMENESSKDSDKEIKIEGLGNIFNFKEFDDIVKAKEFINLFENPDIITDFLTDKNDQSLVITIGEENKIDQLKENTIITSYFKVDENTIGKIGIVGLTRIRYKEVIESIKLVSDLLNE
ncbi:heat-inducible transcriptional repressor HrcA [uncultured Anaerococcus sp.]|uniref:heat-inducible transcriptional repressor HrcA n=1 Tax=uncultured Anaerococcus sp. TaxID=293428 RepID=UPI00288AB122|nr:heat-inducible transcriptional repressor HrcA [uncultured Anaerococcus sp.]